MKQIVVLLSYLLAFVSMNACTSLTASDETIIERSSETKPPWVEKDYTGEGEADMFLVYSKTGIYRLELGLKQAQAAAVAETKRLMLERLQEDLQARAAKALKADAKNAEGSIADAMNMLKSKFAPTDAVPRSVYWENIRRETTDGPRTHYNIYVLATIKRTEYVDALDQAAKHMQASNNPSAQVLAQEISKSLE